MKKKIDETLTTALDTVDTTVLTATKQFDAIVAPARDSITKRYPTLFSLFATLGVVMTFLGVEQLLLASQLLERYPVIILGIGVTILALTGTLYKKLTSL